MPAPTFQCDVIKQNLLRKKPRNTAELIRLQNQLLNVAGTRSEFNCLFTGLWRINNTAGYNFRWNQNRPPKKTDAINDFSETLPYTPDVTFTTGIVYLAMTEFNGTHESDFYPVGPNGEPYVRIDLDAGVQTISPPAKPTQPTLVDIGGGNARCIAYYSQHRNRATQFTISISTDGSLPPVDTATYTATIGAGILVPLTLDLDADLDPGTFPLANGTVLRVRIQTRRNDGTDVSPNWTYSETNDKDVQQITIDSIGPDAPPGAVIYPGYKPKD